MRSRILIASALLVLVLPGIQASCRKKESPDPLDPETCRRVLIEAADVIRDNYADPDAGRILAGKIEAIAEQYGDERSIDAKEMVADVTGVIRSMDSDRHFKFTDRLGSGEGTESSPGGKRSRHGLQAARMLEGRTAYLEFDGFPGDDASMEAVTRTIEALPEMKAVIFDIRDNNGGAGDMVVMLCNRLLEPGVLLYTFAGRSDENPGEVVSSACERHFGTAIPVYILTSGNTLSAAEAFTYILKDLGRAVVVGERTAGMANPSRTITISGRFDLTVPFLMMRYGKSGGTFAGTGVTPDIEVPAESALETALERLKD